MPNLSEPDEVPLVSPAQVAACRRVSREYVVLRRWAARAARRLGERVRAGTATSDERRLWEEWGANQREIAAKGA